MTCRLVAVAAALLAAAALGVSPRVGAQDVSDTGPEWWRGYGMGLPESVLKRIYSVNADELLGRH